MGYHIKWEEKGVFITIEGKIEFEEFLNVNNHLYGKPEFDDAQYQLWYFSDVADTNFDVEDARIVGSMDKAAMRWNENMKVAVVAENRSIIDFVRTYQKMIEGSNWICEVFKDMDHAREWIR